MHPYAGFPFCSGSSLCWRGAELPAQDRATHIIWRTLTLCGVASSGTAIPPACTAVSAMWYTSLAGDLDRTSTGGPGCHPPPELAPWVSVERSASEFGVVV